MLKPCNILNDNKRLERMEGILQRWLGVSHPEARDFILDWLQSARMLDDLYDQDAEVTAEDVMNLADLTLSRMLNNHFYLAFATHIGPVLRESVRSWNLANRVERTAHAASDANHPLLRFSYEMRNTCFNFPVRIVELLYGLAKAEEFEEEWFPVTRSYETFENYVKKVTAKERPQKYPPPKQSNDDSSEEKDGMAEQT